jgi:Sec-independent protein secretion pathway component TatC
MNESAEARILVRGYAYFILVTIAAALTGLFSPASDFLSLILLWLPITVVALALFELGFFLYRQSRNPPDDPKTRDAP